MPRNFHPMMNSFSLATACRAAAFSAAAYQSPACFSRQEIIGGSIVSFFEDSARGTSVPTQESRCSCFEIDAERFAFIDNVQTDTQGPRCIEPIIRTALTFDIRVTQWKFGKAPQREL